MGDWVGLPLACGKIVPIFKAKVSNVNISFMNKKD